MKNEEVYTSTFQIENIYRKKNYNILKLKNNHFEFFTSISNDLKVNKLDWIDLTFITTKINFYSYLKDFYAKSIYYEKYKKSNNRKKVLEDKISDTHKFKKVGEFFNALFLGISTSKELRQIFSNYSISHLIAISGYHLGIISFISFWFIYFPYNYLHKKFFIYRNKKFDISCLCIAVLFFYLIFIGILPSILRSFIMIVIGLYFLRSNIKILSFNTLFFTTVIIIAIYPKFIFSISLWFSIFGVFYIFLFVQYFKKNSLFINLIIFNFWIFFAFNPIVHFFFYNTSYEQLLSPFLTLIFSIFYPLEMFLHLLNFGDIFDKYIIYIFNYKMYIFNTITPLWFFVIYLIVTFFSIFSKHIFYILNILIIIFNIFIYSQGKIPFS